MRKHFAVLAVGCLTLGLMAALGSAQMDKSSRPSPAVQATADLGGGESITVDYSSPKVKGRRIFGGLLPYDQIWRTGANEATTLVTTTDLAVGGKVVPAGTYTIFTIPGESKWTLVISKKTGEWGTDYPGAAEDLVRVDMKVSKLPALAEDFKISFDKSASGLTMNIDWENTRAAVEVNPQNPSAKKVLDEQLLEAIRAGDAEKTRALLRSGANANGSDGFGQPLVAAINGNDATIVRVLVEAGARVNPFGPMGSPLEMAAGADRVEMVRLLLSLGANVDGAGPGRSPLWSALGMNRLEVAKTLIAAGADVKGEKAYAESHHMPGIVKTLEKALGPAPPPMTVEQVVSKLEARWDSMELGEEQQDKDHPTDAEVAKTASELGSRLKAQPQDAQVLLLWARFALVPYIYKISAEYKPSASEAESLPPDVALNRVLAAEPHNAEALYLKGRMYGLVRAGKVGSERDDLGQAIPLLRQAVHFAPDNLRYREILALFLADQGHPGEGKEILRSAQKNHPMIPLLEDLESLSAPEGGQLLAAHALSMDMMIALGDAGVADHLHLRLRTYHYAKSPAEIEAFFASRIPGFRFIAEREEQQGTPSPEGEVGRAYLQFLHVTSGSMKPISQRNELPDPQKAKDGIMMELFELNDDPDLEQKLSPGEHSCYLILVNYRK